MVVIEELRVQVDAVRHKLALAEQAGLLDEAHLHRARLADLRDIAARHAIDLTAAGRPCGAVHPGGVEGDPESGPNPITEPCAGTTSPHTA